MRAKTKAARSLALAIASWSVCPAALQAADQAGKIRAVVDRAFGPLLETHDVPGMAVAVTVGGQQHVFTYGVASRDKSTPVNSDTLFEIGSVSKAFTATLVSCAQALGRLSLDDHPGKYLPALRGSAIDKATLLHLGTYSAGGLPLQFPASVRNDAEMRAFLQGWKPSAGPGEQRRYSNPSIGLLGHLTSLAMKGDFADLIKTEIFDKLKLEHSYIRVPASEMGNYAWGYGKDNKPMRARPGVFDAEAYGVKSTAGDMIRFVEANLRPENVDEPIRRAIRGTQVGYFSVGETVQGLGWEQYGYPVALARLLAGNSTAMVMEAQVARRLTPAEAPMRPVLFNKTGSTNGFGAYVAFVPERKVGIVMLANKNFPVPARITAAHAVLEQLASQAP